jgi:putative phosphoribosyl transferase
MEAAAAGLVSNQQVATYLQKKNFGTLLFDLLTPEEDLHYLNRFNIELLTERLAGVTKWLEDRPAATGCRLGYFGASTGAASALEAAAKMVQVGAVVSRGGRPDLASVEALRAVKAPVLLIVGGLDTTVLELNKQASKDLRCHTELVIVEGATHLFEEDLKMDEVATLASGWFGKYLQPVPMTK